MERAAWGCPGMNPKVSGGMLPAITASGSCAPRYPLSIELCKHWEVLCWWGNTSPHSPKPTARQGLPSSGRCLLAEGSGK